jgi:hypothetical protein
VHTTGSFPVGQLNARQKSFVAFGNVPLEVIEQSEDLSCAVVVRNAKAVAQITDSFFLTWHWHNVEFAPLTRVHDDVNAANRHFEFHK